MAQQELYQRDIEESTIEAWFFISRKTGPADDDFTPGRRISLPKLLSNPELDIQAVASWRSALAIDGPADYTFGNGLEDIGGTGAVQLGGSIEHNTVFELGAYSVDFVSNALKRFSVKDNLIELVNAPVASIKLGNAGCLVNIESEDAGNSGLITITGGGGYFNHSIGGVTKFEIPSSSTKIYMEENLVELQSNNNIKASLGASINFTAFNQQVNLYEDITEIRNGTDGEVYIGRSTANIRIISNIDGTNTFESTASTINFNLPNSTKYHIEDELHELTTLNGKIALDGYSASLVSNDGYTFSVNGDGFQFTGLQSIAGDPGYIYRDAQGFLKIS